MGHKILPQILIMVDDLAGQKEVVRGDLLSPIFFRGKHVVCICIVLAQRYRLLIQVYTTMQTLCFL